MKCSAACRATAARPRSCSTATQLAADHKYFKFGGARHSPDHRLQAWSADIKGSEYFSIRVRDWASGADLDDLVEETDGAVVWSADCKSFFYVKLDDNHRPMQVWRHRLGTPQADDVLVYEEQDSGWFTHLHESSSGRFCVIAGGDHETSEQRLIDLADPDAPPRLVAAREEGVQYSVADRGDELFILTNADGAIDFKVVDRAARRAGARQLARPDPVSRGRLCPRRRALCRPHGAAGARQRAARRSSSAISTTATSTPSPSTRRPIRSTPWAATNSRPPICAFPIRR